MRILELIVGLGGGGAENQLAQLAPALRHAGCEVAVGCLKLPAGAAGLALQRAGVEPWALGGRFPLDPRPLRRLRQRARRFAPDLVHTHLARADWLGGRLARELRVPHLITRHSDFEPWARWRPLWQSYQRTLRAADGLLAVSDQVAERLVTWGAPRGRVRVVRSLLAEPELRALPARRVPGRVIGFVGRCDKVKGIDRFCLLAARLAALRPELSFVVAGDGPLRRPLQRACERRGLPVRWLGWQSLVGPVLRDVDVVLAPSRSEGLGLAAAEALAAGRRVVGSATGGLAPLLDEHPGGEAVFAPPGELLDAFAEATLRALSSPLQVASLPSQLEADRGAWARQVVRSAEQLLARGASR